MNEFAKCSVCGRDNLIPGGTHTCKGALGRIPMSDLFCGVPHCNRPRDHTGPHGMIRLFGGSSHHPLPIEELEARVARLEAMFVDKERDAPSHE